MSNELYYGISLAFFLVCFSGYMYSYYDTSVELNIPFNWYEIALIFFMIAFMSMFWPFAILLFLAFIVINHIC